NTMRAGEQLNLLNGIPMLKRRYLALLPLCVLLGPEYAASGRGSPQYLPDTARSAPPARSALRPGRASC
ncbi:hypothetical protein FK513_28875, partial [Klebsiella pneumoniae]|nr:hypothetical protein [Klebsiella pneumoniae]